MSKKAAKFSKPKRPLSFKAVVKRILDEPDFAKFIHGEVRKARRGSQKAADTVFVFFRPLPKELTALKLPHELLEHRNVKSKFCTTTFQMIDFATPAQIWPK